MKLSILRQDLSFIGHILIIFISSILTYIPFKTGTENATQDRKNHELLEIPPENSLYCNNTISMYRTLDSNSLKFVSL